MVFEKFDKLVWFVKKIRISTEFYIDWYIIPVNSTAEFWLCIKCKFHYLSSVFRVFHPRQVCYYKIRLPSFSVMHSAIDKFKRKSSSVWIIIKEKGTYSNIRVWRKGRENWKAGPSSLRKSLACLSYLSENQILRIYLILYVNNLQVLLFPYYNYSLHKRYH